MCVRVCARVCARVCMCLHVLLAATGVLGCVVRWDASLCVLVCICVCACAAGCYRRVGVCD